MRTANRFLTVAIAATLLGLAALPVAAQKKLYRWVDADGKVHISDQLPPEAVDQARREINAESGAAVASVDRALTPEELAAQAAAREAAMTDAERAAAQRRQDMALLSSYPTEADLERAFGDRLDLLQQNIAAGEAGVAGQRNSLTAILADAAEAELAGRAIDPKRAGMIRDIHAELIAQQNILTRRAVELAALGHERERVLARYRELRSTDPAQGAPAAPDPASTDAPAPASTEPAPSGG